MTTLAWSQTMDELKSSPFIKFVVTIAATLISAAVIGVASYSVSQMSRVDSSLQALTVLITNQNARLDERVKFLESDYARRQAGAH